MKPIMHVWPEAPKKKQGRLTLSARIELGDNSIPALWFQLPEAQESAIAKNHDSFAVATLLAAMGQSRQLIIHGEVSPSLLANLEEFQAAWASWLPAELSEIPITAEVEREPTVDPARSAAISAFSGGVDSSYTAFCHAKGLNGRTQQPLKAGLFVHGFDIALNQPEVFERATQRAARMLSSLGMDVIPLATNFRTVMDPLIHWEHSFGTGIAAGLLLLQNRFSQSLIPSSYTYRELTVPYGSTPVTDRLLGHRHFAIVHDGARHGRFDKITAISHWPEALEHLRVCWQGAEPDHNCCQCEKCIRNILTFRLIQSALPPCFETDVSVEQIRRLRLRGGPLDALKHLHSAAQSQAINAPWVDAIAAAIRQSQRTNFIRQHIKVPLKQRLKGVKKPQG